jgi:hypothetical protein
VGSGYGPGSGFNNPIAFYSKSWQKIIMEAIMQCKRNLLLKMLRVSNIFIIACMLLPAFAGPAWSGGLYLNEFGTPSMGTAGAGANAVASDAGGPAPIIGGFFVHSLSDKWKLGANLITINGAVLYYDDDWTGRYLNTEVK